MPDVNTQILWPMLSMMLLTVPIFFPLASQLGFDLIWFGVIVLLALEISFTTPPFGLLLFVMSDCAGDQVGVHQGTTLHVLDSTHTHTQRDSSGICA